MLGNGYCARPVELDYHFESICESCTFLVTTIEFRPTLESPGPISTHSIFAVTRGSGPSVGRYRVAVEPDAVNLP